MKNLLIFIVLIAYLSADLDNKLIYQFKNLGDNGGLKDFINIKIKLGECMDFKRIYICLIKGAGHMAHADKRLSSLTMFSSFIKG